jgi:hypothetical protein
MMVAVELALACLPHCYYYPLEKDPETRMLHSSFHIQKWQPLTLLKLRLPLCANPMVVLA